MISRNRAAAPDLVREADVFFELRGAHLHEDLLERLAVDRVAYAILQRVHLGAIR